MGTGLKRKSDGKIVMWQSHSSPGVMEKNALNAGFNLDEYEEVELTKEEHKQNLFDHEVKPKQDQRKQRVAIKRNAVKAQLGLNDNQLDDLIDVVRNS